MATSIPSAWADLLQQFFPLFTAPTGPLFARLLTGWVLCTTRRTITGILAFADPEGWRSHDAYHRFFPDACWDPGALWRVLAQILIRAFYPDGTILLDLDDTVFHRSGRKVEGAGWWRDPVRSTATCVVKVWGLNLVILTLRVTPPWGGMPLGLPLHVALHRKDGPKLTELARQMLADVTAWFPERVFRVHADGFYASLADDQIYALMIFSSISTRPEALGEISPFLSMYSLSSLKPTLPVSMSAPMPWSQLP